MESHGPGTSLLEHLKEVSQGAKNSNERIILVTHDIGKATEHWQDYSQRGFTGESPHYHASAGSILASAIIALFDKNDNWFWSAVALHTNSAHHSYLSDLKGSFIREEISFLINSEKAYFFLTDCQEGIASLIPEIPVDFLSESWELLKGVVTSSPIYSHSFWGNLLSELERFNSHERLSVFQVSRRLLGKLCFYDHQSAKKQSGKLHGEIEPIDRFFPQSIIFEERPHRDFGKPTKKLNKFRNFLKDEFLKVIDENSLFYFIDAPTGMGKTETMLRGAENLVRQYSDLNRIVYAVPQVSIADQIFEEYILETDGQIWDYLRKETTRLNNGGEGSRIEETTGGLQETLFFFNHPFSRSYNVTTFNQVILSIAHPHRYWSERSLGLSNAVIILDEFHKLPLVILPYFFRLARDYAERFYCRFILGSATPLANHPGLGLGQMAEIPKNLTEEIYKHAILNRRRIYKKAGDLNIKDVIKRIEAHRDEGEGSLLVVLNLVGKGTWLLRRYFKTTYDPWEELEQLETEERPVIFLDGLTPPLLRREIIKKTKIQLKKKSVVFITTQMVEVGVDLDFDRALIDFQGWASIIQRGGRVGREGRTEPSQVEVFSLNVDDEKSSFEILIDVRNEYDLRYQAGIFDESCKVENRLNEREIRWFKQWGDCELTDEDIKRELLILQEKVFKKLPLEPIQEGFFNTGGYISDKLGFSFQNSQYVADLYNLEVGVEFVLFEDIMKWNELNCLIKSMRAGNLILAKKVRKIISDRLIRTYNTEFIYQSQFIYVGTITDLDGLKAYSRPGSNIL